MFSRSSKKRNRKLVSRPAKITVIKPEQKEQEPALDLAQAKITVIKPNAGLRVMVEENEGEEDE